MNSWAAKICAVVLTAIVFPGSALAAFLQDSGPAGIISINASSFSDRIAQGSHAWSEVTPNGHQGTAALEAVPDIGANINTGFETLSPRVDYRVNFNRTGIHYIWVRGIGSNGSNDSLHIGLDGAVQPSSDRISLDGRFFDFGWTNETMDLVVATIDVPTVGLHTINVWMREDGTVFDKLVITSDGLYTPEDDGPTGPAQSNEGTPTLAAPSISPNGGTFANSVTVQLTTVEPLATIVFTVDGTDPTVSGTAQIYDSPFQLTVDATVRAYGFAPGYNDSAESDASFVIVEVQGPLAFLQDPGADGIVAVNASSFSDRIAQGGHSWDEVTPPGHQGTAALQALPDIGVNNDTGFEGSSPRLDYQVNFEHTGPHYVWVRGIGSDGDNDSLHVGLDGIAQLTSDRISGFDGSFGWSNSTMDIIVATIDVPTTGLHTVNVWMREDGMIFDKLVLTTNMAYSPQANGPAQSPQGTPALAPPTISPNGGSFPDSVTVTLASNEQSAEIIFTLDGTDPKSSGTAQTYQSPFLLSQDTTVRSYATAEGFGESSEASAGFVITEGGVPLALLQDGGSDGLVSINASSFIDRVAQGGHAWADVYPAGYQGVAALQAQPNVGTNLNTGFEALSPRVDYRVDFNRTGLHYIWVRGIGADGDDDSLHVGLDGVAQDGSVRISGFDTSFGWSGDTMDGFRAVIDVPTPGTHTLNVWMREDGMVFDKLVLTTNEAYTPVGTGPVQSIQGMSTLAPPVISPGGGSFTGPDPVTVTLSSNEPSAEIIFTVDGTDPKLSGTAQTYQSSFQLSQDTTVRSYAIAEGFGDSAEASASFVFIEAGVPLAFLQDGGSDGIVSINASGFVDRIPQGGHAWADVYPTGHQGAAALQAQPNIGTNRNTGFEALSPRVDYRVDFNRTGLHFIWVRGIGANGDDDSLHIGLDGVAQESSLRISGFDTNFGWSGESMDGFGAVIDVPTTGTHTLNVWMREDGMVFDKLVLTTNEAYTPVGTGPVQSTQGMPTLAPPVINPGGGYFSGSQSVTLSTATAGATIVYTLDGSDPRTSGSAAVYTAPFDISASTTINAAARLADYFDSGLATKEFTQTACQISRVMPLGDSITEGIFGPVAAGPGIFTRGGYRSPLYRSLVDNGYAVTFEGSQSAGSALVPQIDADHEGRSGWADELVAANVYQLLVDNPADIVLLHVGTNNFETSVADVENILDEVDRFEADMGVTVTVVVAKIINRKTYHAPTSAFNANLEALVLSRIGSGDQVVLVDQESALNYGTDMFDNLHPNSGGYGKMGATWFTELQSQISVCGG